VRIVRGDSLRTLESLLVRIAFPDTMLKNGLTDPIGYYLMHVSCRLRHGFRISGFTAVGIRTRGEHPWRGGEEDPL